MPHCGLCITQTKALIVKEAMLYHMIKVLGDGIMIYYGIIFLVWLIAVILMTGKGGFLIAGYHTAPKKEKRKYDEKKLSRTYGIGMMVIAIFITIPYILGDEKAEFLLPFMPVVIIVTIIAMLIVGNFFCRKKATEEETENGNAAEEQDTFARKYGSLILIIIMLILILPMLYLGEVKITYEPDFFTVSVSGWKNKQISYSEITEITRQEAFDVGSRTGGLGTAKLLAGNFRNGTFGDYELYAYKNSTDYIILYRLGKNIVIGLNSREEADRLYDALLEKIREPGEK